MIEMNVESVRVSYMNYQRVVILKEKTSERYLPIWIGPAEADAIAVKVHSISVARPLTHDLLQSIIGALGAKVQSVLIDDLQNDTFYAKLILAIDGKKMEIDSRPSDAIALALRAQAPIFASESVLERAGIILTPEGDKAKAEGKTEGTEKPSAEELGRLSAFSEFIDKMDFKDFDKRKS